MQVQVQKLECKRCGYKWTPRKEDVRSCPKCRSIYWDDSTVEFQKMGFETMKQFALTNQMIAETHNIAIENRDGLKVMGQNIEKLVAALEKHLTQESKRTAVSLPPGAEMTVKKTG